MTTTVLTIIGIIVGLVSIVSGIMSGMVLYQLRSITGRIVSLETGLNTMQRQPVECQREFVGKEDWVRDGAYNRQTLDAMAKTLSRMEGRMDFADRMPELAANIIRQTVAAVVTHQTQGAPQ